MIRHLLFLALIVLVAACDGDEGGEKTVERISDKSSTAKEQLKPLVVNVEQNCGPSSAEFQQQLSAQLTGKGQTAATAAAVAPPSDPWGRWPTPTPTPGAGGGSPNVSQNCMNAVMNYMMIVKALRGHDTRDDQGRLVPGPVLWQQDMQYRQLAMQLLGISLRQAGGNVLTQAQMALYALRNPGSIAMIGGQLGLGGNELMGYLNGASSGGGGYSLNLNAPTAQSSYQAPPSSYGNGVLSLGEKVGYAPTTRSAPAVPAPPGVSSGPTMTGYRNRYGGDWFARRRGN